MAKGKSMGRPSGKSAKGKAIKKGSAHKGAATRC